MTKWTLEKAKNGFSEVVRRALAHKPQLVTRGARENEAVVVIAREDYEQLLAPRNFAAFLAESPLAKAVAEGAFGGPASAEPFVLTRSRDTGRPGLGAVSRW